LLRDEEIEFCDTMPMVIPVGVWSPL
jgi:hypothetical protein